MTQAKIPVFSTVTELLTKHYIIRQTEEGGKQLQQRATFAGRSCICLSDIVFADFRNVISGTNGEVADKDGMSAQKSVLI